MLLKSLLGLEDHLFGPIFYVHQFTTFFVGRSIGFRFSLHSLDFFLRQSARVVDSNVSGFSSGLFSSRHLQDAIGVNIEFDLNLRRAHRGWRDPTQIKSTQRSVVCGKLSLALQNVDGH